MNGLAKAIQAAGNASRLAEALNVSAMTISHWRHRLNGVIPADRVPEVYRVTGVLPHELRPDLHPTPTSGIPEQDIASAKRNSD
ncbi:transcriptional regulator [Cronobacter dublinensis]|uniref:transcriptional regulator n=1 Tax=Cronobacter dublinensis TaxID=413497 RepID=UPI00300DEAB1